MVLFVEKDPRAAELIVDHATSFGVNHLCHIVRGTLPDVIDHGTLQGDFDLILLDPPYDDPSIGAILSAVGQRLAEEGVLILEQARRSDRPAGLGLLPVRQVVSGDSVLHFYGRSRQ